MSSRVKKSFIFTGKILSVFLACIFLFSSCDNFLTDNEEFKSLMEEEVHDSTAKELNVTVQAVPGQGNASCSAKTVKLDVTFQVSFEPDTSYGSFNVWKAYANYEKKNQRELGAEDIFFSSATSLTTEVKILKDCGDIRIVPYCTKHPQVNIIMPDGLVNPGTITPSGQHQMEAGKEYSVTVQTSTDYGFIGWRIFTKEGDIEYDLKNGVDYSSIEYEPEVSENSRNLGSTKSSVSITLLKSNFQNSIYITPVLYEYPEATIQFPKEYQSDVGTLSPAGEKRLCPGIEYKVSLVTKSAYGVRSWKIYSVKGDEQTDLFVNGAVTEAGEEIISVAEGETTVSTSAISEGAVTTSIVLALLELPDDGAKIYVEPLVYQYPALNIVKQHVVGNEEPVYDKDSTLTPEETRKIIVGNEYAVKFKTSANYGFREWSVYELVLGDGGKYSKKALVNGTDYDISASETDTTAAGITTANAAFIFRREFTNPVYIVPVVYSYPNVTVQFPKNYQQSDAGTLSPTGNRTMRPGIEYRINLVTKKYIRI